MQINDIFNLSKYDEAFNFVSKNEGVIIKEIEPRLENVEKTRQVEKFDENGIPYIKEEKYTVQEYVKYYQLVELPKPSLDKLKLAKREEINQARDEAEQGGFTYMGKVFDSDQVSCLRITAAAQAMSLLPASDENKITWTTQDNSTIDLTAAELMGLVGALAQWSNTCHEKATKLKEQIEACQTAEELEKIQWNNSEVMK